MNNIKTAHAQIPGWGSDIGRRNGTHGSEPFPMRLSDTPTGEPSQQPQTVEVLTSTEHAGITPVFGATLPPRGISGMCRRLAFRFSENDLRHWLLLLFADRVNVGEGLVSDVSQGHVPNVFKEMGAAMEWQHNPRGVIKKVAIVGVVVSVFLLVRSRRRR